MNPLRYSLLTYLHLCYHCLYLLPSNPFNDFPFIFSCLLFESSCNQIMHQTSPELNLFHIADKLSSSDIAAATRNNLDRSRHLTEGEDSGEMAHLPCVSTQACGLGRTEMRCSQRYLCSPLSHQLGKMVMRCSLLYRVSNTSSFLYSIVDSCNNVTVH